MRDRAPFAMLDGPWAVECLATVGQVLLGGGSMPKAPAAHGAWSKVPKMTATIRLQPLTPLPLVNCAAMDQDDSVM